MSDQQLLETWAIHDRINRYLLAALTPEQLGLRVGKKGRSAGEIVAHIHNVRLMWLKSGDATLLEGLTKVEKDQAEDAAALNAALEASGAAIATLLTNGLQQGKIKGFKPHPVAFLGYLISHESHHRGEIERILGDLGQQLDQKVSFGLWEWGVR
jgi:uncharacterized damage-inducible protein DinB